MEETDLASFLSPAGSVLGDVTQRVFEFLSVQDLIQYVASSTSDNGKDEVDSPEHQSRRRSSTPSGGGGGRGGAAVHPCRQGAPAVFDSSNGKAVVGAQVGCSRERKRASSNPEEELPHRHQVSARSSRGEGDEAGGRSRAPIPRDRKAQRDDDLCADDYDEEEGLGGGGGEFCCDGEGECGAFNKEARFISAGRGSGGLGVEVVVLGACHRKEEEEEGEEERLDGKTKSKPCKNEGPSILGILIGLGLHPWAALGAIRGGVAHLLGGVPLLALLRWAAGGAAAVLGVSFRVALLPYDVTKGVVLYVVGSLEAMLNVAMEVGNAGLITSVVICVPAVTAVCFVSFVGGAQVPV